MEVSVKHDQEGTIEKLQRPKYLEEMIAKWEQWTLIEGEDVEEALTDFTGNMWKEMRRLQAMICEEMEAGGVSEEIKESYKDKLAMTWRHIITNQKMGLDKLGIIVRGKLEDAKKK